MTKKELKPLNKATHFVFVVLVAKGNDEPPFLVSTADTLQLIPPYSS